MSGMSKALNDSITSLIGREWLGDGPLSQEECGILLADRDHWKERAGAPIEGEMDLATLRELAKRLAIAATGDDKPTWDGPQVISFALMEGRTAFIKAHADLDEARAKLAELREMERERNAFQHAFNLLATRVTNTIRPSDTDGQRDDTLEICKQVIARLRKGHAFATELAAIARVYEKKAP